VSLLFRKLKLPKGTSLHSLRHTHASELLDIGVSLPVVSARLGHSSERVTADIYSHASTARTTTRRAGGRSTVSGTARVGLRTACTSGDPRTSFPGGLTAPGASVVVRPCVQI
jgi:hypothetical protein